ncbi:MAG TPA: hypothetical protein VNL39_00845, partial [Xanthobacteraceae bacterium]|nr:hypothetical protein [Xanthobacteraceae bacterium]
SAPPIERKKIDLPIDHPVRAWQITPWFQIHGITYHPRRRDFFSSLLGSVSRSIFAAPAGENPAGAFFYL